MADHHTFLLIVVFSFQFAITSAQELTIKVYCSNESAHYQSYQYQHNLDNLLQKLSNTDKAFDKSMEGESQVHGLYLCRGNATDQICRMCVHNATSTIVNPCPYSVGDRIVYDYCTSEDSNVSSLNKLEYFTEIYMWNVKNITGTSVGSFAQVVNETMSEIAAGAAKGDPLGQKLATKETNYTADNRTLYALGQCMQDLSFRDCYTCLTNCIEQLPSCCSGKQGGRVLFLSCNIRYEIYSFYENAAAPAPSPAPPPSKQLPAPPTRLAAPPTQLAALPNRLPPPNVKKKRLMATVTGATVAAVGFVLLFAMAVLYFRRRKAKNRTDASHSKMVDIASLVAMPLEYDLSTLQIATDNFSDNNRIGKGGFGVVYKGILENGDEIAVKRLSCGSDQGVEEFKNEVVLVAKLQHKNLVRLLGFCLAEKEKLLVYEFVPNKSLDYILFDPDKQAQLNWATRHKIIVGIARGLLYLHEESRLKIIHRDLKAANILLDLDMNPKISDFGTARLIGMDQSMNETQQKAGTLGYMAPEYLLHGKFSVKSDVYSFGVLMLEIVCGKKVRSFQQLGYDDDLLSSAWKHWRDGTTLEFMDSSLTRSWYSSDQVMCCIQLGLLCVQHDFKKDPL